MFVLFPHFLQHMNKPLQFYIFTIPVCGVTGFANRLSVGDFPTRYNTARNKTHIRQVFEYGWFIPIFPHALSYVLGYVACESMDEFMYKYFPRRKRVGAKLPTKV